VLGRVSIGILVHQNLDCEGASKIYGCLALEKADEKEGGLNTAMFDYSAPNFFCLELWMRSFKVKVMWLIGHHFADFLGRVIEESGYSCVK
jgi:hypothetical protein